MIPADVLRKIRQIQIRTDRLVNDMFAGHYHSAFKGQGMAFQEVREYVAGDEIRSIDWNVTARMGHPYVKQFTEERELTVMLVVDVSASHHFGSTAQFKQDLAAELAGVLAFSAFRNHDRVGMILFTEGVEHYVPPRQGIAHVLRMIRDVLYFTPRHTGTQMEPALQFLNHVQRRRSVTFLISDFIGSQPDRGFRVTARHHDLVAIILGDKRERVLPSIGLVDWEDAETGEHYMVDTSDRRTRETLNEMHGRERTQLRDRLQNAQVDAIEVNAGESYVREFIGFFQKRERRRHG